MTRDDSGGPGDFRAGNAEAPRSPRAVFAVAGGALLLLLIGLLVPRTCPPTIQILTDAETQCAVPDHRLTVALGAAVVVAFGCTISAVAARGPATAKQSRNFRTGIVVAGIGCGLGLVMLMALASGLVLGALR